MGEGKYLGDPEEPTVEVLLAEQRTRNSVAAQRLAAGGMGIGMDVLLILRLNTLVDTLWPEGTEDRAVMELNYEQQVGRALAQALEAGKKPRLLTPQQGPLRG